VEIKLRIRRIVDTNVRQIVGGYDLRGRFRRFCLQVSWFDLILVVYLAGFLRQYFWIASDNPTAWILTGLFSILLLALVIRNREMPTPLGPPRFWLIVGLPLVLMYVIRLPFPDFNYDVLNYHLINTERALRGWPMGPGDFFPGVLLVNPAPDIVDGVFRFALGYRLGTIINLLAMLWAAAIINNLLRRYVYSETLRYICVLFVVSTEHVLFLLNLYMVDLLALPLMLEATHQILRFDEIRRKDRAIVHIGLLLGVSTAFKLTNLAFALPLIMICAKSCLSHRYGIRFRYVVLAGLVFLMPILPFCLYMYVQTGSPVFPYFNKLFRSPYVEAKNYDVPWLGPKSLLEKVLWPFWSYFFPGRLSPMIGRNGYAGRILVGYALVIGGLMMRETRKLCFICFVSFALWVISSGDLRYGIQLELLSGVAIIGLIASVYRRSAQAQIRKQFHKAAALVAIFACLLSFQTYRAYSNALTHREFISEASQTDRVVQPTVFGHTDDFVRESRFLLNDHSSERFLSPDERHLIDKVDLWINSYEATSGIEAELKPNVPMVSVCDFFTLFDYLKSRQSVERLTRTLAESPGKRMFSISNRAHLRDSMAFIQRVGLKIGDVRDIEVPFFSPSTRLKVVLIEVLWPDPDSVTSQSDSPETNNSRTSNIHE
jgi:hypothetical protein